jgi:hypothetical protein
MDDPESRDGQADRRVPSHDELRIATIGAEEVGAAYHGPSMSIAPRGDLPGPPLGARLVSSAAILLLRCRELDLIRTDPEHGAEPTHLRDLRVPTIALPEIDGLRLGPHRERQVKLRPAPFPTQRTDRVHHSQTPLLSLREQTLADVLLQLYYSGW